MTKNQAFSLNFRQKSLSMEKKSLNNTNLLTSCHIPLDKGSKTRYHSFSDFWHLRLILRSLLSELTLNRTSHF